MHGAFANSENFGGGAYSSPVLNYVFPFLDGSQNYVIVHKKLPKK